MFLVMDFFVFQKFLMGNYHMAFCMSVHVGSSAELGTAIGVVD